MILSHKRNVNRANRRILVSEWAKSLCQGCRRGDGDRSRRGKVRSRLRERKITPVLSGSCAGDGEYLSQTCYDGNEKKVSFRRFFLILNGPKVEEPPLFSGKEASQLCMLIIKCFDIDESLFLSRLDLERKINADASLQALKKPANLCSWGQLSRACIAGSKWVTVLAAGASKDC